MADYCRMERSGGRLWHALREHATHWAVGGVLIAATGFAPEEWFARTVEHLHMPESALHLWNDLGRHAQARAEALVALRLNPREPNSSMAASVITQSYYFERDYAGAVAAGRRYLANYSVHPAIRRALLAALGQLGMQEEAQAVLREWQEPAPDQFALMGRKRPRSPYMSPQVYEHLNEGMRKAGMDT